MRLSTRLLAVLTLALAACGAFPIQPPGPAATAAPPVGPARLFAVERANAPAVLASGETRLVSITIANRGSAAWRADGTAGTAVSYHWEGNGGATTKGDAAALPADVPPGASIDVVVPVVAPASPGAYTLVWDVLDAAGALEGAPDERRVGVAVKEPEARASWDAVTGLGPVYTDVESSLDVSLTNSGTVAWPAKGAGAVALSYHWRDAAGAVARWDGQRTVLRDTIVPGERARAAVRVAGPSAPGRYVLELDLVRDGIGWFGGGPKVVVDVAVSSRRSLLTLVGAPSRVTSGQPVDVTLSLKNTGDAPWPSVGDRRVRLSYHVANADAVFVLWDGPRTELPKAVGAGDALQVRATVRAPTVPGRYKLRFDLVQEGAAWFDRLGNVPLDVSLEVVPVDYRAYFQSTETVSTMATGLEYVVRPTIVNVGDSTWSSAGSDPVRLGAHWLDAAGGVVQWDAARADLARNVGPKESVTQPIRVTAPERPGAYTLVVDVVQEGVTWFGPKGTRPAALSITVAPPTFKATIAGAVPATARAGAIVHAPMTVRNDGPFAWPAGGEYPVALAHHWRTPDGALVAWDGFRTPLPHDVAPGESVTLDVWLFTPATAGTYELQVDVVQEGVTWFADRGSLPLTQRVDVTP